MCFSHWESAQYLDIFDPAEEEINRCKYIDVTNEHVDMLLMVNCNE